MDAQTSTLEFEHAQPFVLNLLPGSLQTRCEISVAVERLLLRLRSYLEIPLHRWEGLNGGELRTKRLPSLDGRGWGRVETSGIQHPHPTSPVEGEEFNSAALASPVEGEEFNSAALTSPIEGEEYESVLRSLLRPGDFTSPMGITGSITSGQ
jgi:hypothetical protein